MDFHVLVDILNFKCCEILLLICHTQKVKLMELEVIMFHHFGVVSLVMCGEGNCIVCERRERISVGETAGGGRV